MRVQILTTYPIADASRRLRIEPLIREFESRGHSVHVHELFTDYVFRHKNGVFLKRIAAALVLLIRMVARVFLCFRRQQIVIVHREAMPVFTPFFERIVCRRAEYSILDVDDAIYANPTHSRDWRSIMRQPRNALKFADIFDEILCGNPQLMRAFGTGSARTRLVPTCPPEEVWSIDRAMTPSGRRPVIGWTGSQSTLASLESVLEATLLVCEETDASLIVLGGANVSELPSHPRLTAQRWSLSREQQLLATADVGIMPLIDTEWERGKSGYKAVLFLCAGMRVVASPVGVNAELIKRYEAVADGSEWQHALKETVLLAGIGPLPEATRAEARHEFSSDAVASAVVDSVLSTRPH